MDEAVVFSDVQLSDKTKRLKNTAFEHLVKM